MRSYTCIKTFAVAVLIALILPLQGYCQKLNDDPQLDKKVREFLKQNSRQWYDMNVPESDGQLLFDIITENGYTSALEIGTSTGHSAIWIAWAMSKTGGKLITLEIDERRYNTAVSNFKEAGLIDFIDARLGDAHKMVPKLKGPFDFVFSDADKGWYKNYFIAVDPNLIPGGCFTAHNVSEYRSRYRGGTSEFLEYIKSLSNYETKVNSSGGGLSISYKKSSK